MQPVTCPFCHTPHGSLTLDAMQAGDGWACVRCGQQWNARRLETVAAYNAWVLDHERGTSYVAATEDARPARLLE